jgi:RNA polymerase sigma factor (sigma-70 family)
MSSASVAFTTYSLEPANPANALAAAKQKILADARQGDREAFAEMVFPYAPGLYRRALRLTGNPADAEDVRQEALLKAFSRLNQFAGQQDGDKDDLHAWVSRITTNASIDLIRQRREGKYVSLEEPGIAPDETLGGRSRAPLRASRRTCAKSVCCAMSCSIPRPKWPRVSGFRRWRCACGSSGRTESCAKVCATACGRISAVQRRRWYACPCQDQLDRSARKSSYP